MAATTRPQTRNVFAATDAMDVAAVVALFATDARVVFGNGQPMVGVDEIGRGTTAFYDTIARLHHEIVGEWKVGSDTLAQLKLTHDPQDSPHVNIPPLT